MVQIHQQMAAYSHLFLSYRTTLGAVQQTLLPHSNLSHYSKEDNFQPFSWIVKVFTLAMIMEFQSSFSALTLRICYQIHLLKQEDPEVEQSKGFCTRQFGYNYSCWTWPWRAAIAFSWPWLLTDDWFRGQVLYTESNCSWWSSALLYWNQSHDMVL